jgi:parvulin-like peptidyl-prolyl isomerase
VRYSLIAAAALVIGGSHCAPASAQPPATAAHDVTFDALSADAASLDGCQVIARIEGQVVLACEVLWEVNKIIEMQGDRIPSSEVESIRRQLVERQLATLLDRKLIYAEFRRTFPAERLPELEEGLRKPFEEEEVPRLMKVLEVDSRQALEQELVRLGSSLADARRSFNEMAIVSNWVQTKVKINEEVRPDELLEFYRAHLAEYEYPSQARWEELMVRKSRFASPYEAYKELALMGNEVWNRWAAVPGGVNGAAFADMAKARSDGFNASDGGLHDWTTKGALKDVALDQELFTRTVGQMSPILETETAFHIVRVLERKEAGRRPFTEVQGEIREKLKAQRRQEARTAYLERLRRNARIWTAFAGETTAEVLMSRAQGGAQAR